jgi:peptide/nickel transport system permease protein
VINGIGERLPVTLELTFFSMLLALVIALPTGIISAVKPNSRWDIAGSLFSLSGVAIPHFWLGILLIYGFAVYAKVLPPSGYVPFTEDPAQNLKYMILPSITLGTGLTATMMRQVRSSLLEVLQQDYIVAARAKGLLARTIILRHALKNGLIPVVTVIGLQAGILFGGAVITETIFAIPGVGRWAVDSILWRDFPVVQAISLVMAIGVLCTNLITDIAYAYIDPRIRHHGS